jgi:hypothetical protein
MINVLQCEHLISSGVIPPPHCKQLKQSWDECEDSSSNLITVGFGLIMMGFGSGCGKKTSSLAIGL